MKKSNLISLILASMCFISGCGNQINNQTEVGQNTAQSVDYSKKYDSILETYRNFVQSNLDENISNLNEPWDGIRDTLGAFQNDKTKFGYAFKDLNNSGIPELILLAGEQEAYSICAIYSLVNDKPKLLGSYHYRNICSIGSDGTIYNFSAGSANENNFNTYKIKNDGTGFETIASIQTVFESNDKEPEGYTSHFYKVQNNNEKVEITQEEAENLFAQTPEDIKESGIEFTPLF